MADTQLDPELDKGADEAAEQGLSDYAEQGTNDAQDYLGQVDERSRDRQSKRNGGEAERAAKKAGKSFLKKNAKRLIGSSVAILGFIASAAVIFFFLLLLKNIHIKHLFIDYEFAKFNRAFNSRIRDAIAESKPTGTPDTNVPADAPPADQMDKASQADVEKLKTDPKAADQAGSELTALDQGIEGTGGTVVADLNLERSVADESGKTDAEQQKDTQKTINDEVAGNEQASKAPLDSIDQAAKDAQANAGPDPTNSVLQSEAVKSLSGKMFSGVQKLSGPFVIATFACIARDIFETGFHLYAQLKLTGLAQSATINAKHADCQKLNKCTIAQIGTVANQFDNGSQSFTQTAAYQRVTGQGVTTDPKGQPVNDLEEQMKPTSHPSDAISQLLNIAHTTLNLPLIGDVCHIVLQPGAQIAFAALNIGVTAFAAITGAIDFGISDVALAAGQSALVIFASKAGKALAIDAAMHYGGLLFKGKFNPIQWGNMEGAGSKALAYDSCRKTGCRKLSPQENQTLVMAIQKDRTDAMKQKSVLVRLFDATDPYSALGMAVDRMPTSPSAVLANLNNVFANVFNVNRLMTSAGQFGAVIAHPSNAFAATVESDTYGIPDYGFTDAETSRWSVRFNSDWVKNHMDGYNTYKSKCLDTKAGDALASPDPECSNTDDNHLHYRLYALDQRATHDLVLLYNHQDGTITNNQNTGGGGTPPPGPVTPGAYSWPTQVAGSTITQCFTGVAGVGHPGVDIANAQGTPVYAAAAGTVAFSGAASGYGPNFVIIKHGPGNYTSYGHMISKSVNVNDTVTPGQVIGAVGNLGVSTGPHLHFNLTLGTDSIADLYNGNVNPLAKGLAIPAGVPNPHNCPTQ